MIRRPALPTWRLAAIAILGLLAGALPAAAQLQPSGGGGGGGSASNPSVVSPAPGQTFPTNDPNNAAFSTPTPFTVGGPAVAVGRSTAAVCTAAGTVTYTMPGGTLSWPLVIGGQILPFAVTGASSGPACTYTNLN